MNIIILSVKWNPRNVSLLILSALNTNSNLVFQTAKFRLWFCVKTIHVVNIVPQKVFTCYVLLEILIAFL